MHWLAREPRGARWSGYCERSWPGTAHANVSEEDRMAERLLHAYGCPAEPRLGVGIVVTLGCIVCLAVTRLAAEPVAVRYTEGIVHGFLALRTLDGKTIADGDLLQV